MRPPEPLGPQHQLEGFDCGNTALNRWLQQRRRVQIAQRFLSGEWGVELETYEADQERERHRVQDITP